MKSAWKRILPIVLAIAILFSIGWYLFVYDRDFTRDMLLKQARFFESRGNHSVATWFYNQAYRQADNNAAVAIELAEQFKSAGNYTRAEYTLAHAIADGGSAELYIALCKTYVEQDKLLDAVAMLDGITDPAIKEELDMRRPAAPTVTPAPGFYRQYIGLTFEGSGKLYVSADGEYPSIYEDLYTDSIALSAGENTIYALCVDDQGLVSPLAVFGYTVGGVIEEVHLADTDLEARLREELELAEDAPLLTSDLWTLSSLELTDGVKDYADLQYFTYLKSLTIKNGGEADLQALSKMSLLEELYISGTNLSVKDLGTIAALPNLSKLTLSGCGLTNIQALEAAGNLTELDLSNNTVKDLSALSAMGALEHLDLSRNALSDLSPLAGCTALTWLDVSYNSLTAVSPLAACTALSYLDITQNSITALQGLESCTALETLHAGYNALTGLNELTGLTGLIRLDISNNSLTELAPLLPLVKLEYLNFSYNEVSELPAWPTTCALVEIDGSSNTISSLSALSGFGQLNNVYMDSNNISSVRPLADCPNLILVKVSDNPVNDVSMLTEQGVAVYYTPKV